MLQHLTDLKNAEDTQDSERKNKGFTQVYKKGWIRIDKLIAEYPLAARVYTFLANTCDKLAGVVTTQESIAKELEVSIRSIQRATKWLDEQRIVPRLKVSGSVYLYCLDPEEIWKSWDDKKQFALFTTITIIDLKDNDAIFQKLKSIYLK